MLTGCDVSYWQDNNDTPKKVDFNKMVSAGARFCFIRAAFGLTQDIDFLDNWKNSKGVIPRGAYIFPVTAVDMVKQIQKFIDLLKEDPGELPPVLDIEAWQSTVPSSQLIKTAIGMIEQQLKRKPIIYTGFYVWRDQVKGNDSFFKNYDLWIATYGPSPLVPAPWSTYKFWQYSAKGDGPAFGAESLNIDMDYFAGDEVDFKKYLAEVAGTATTPATNPSTSSGTRKVQVSIGGVAPVNMVIEVPKEAGVTLMELS